MDNMENLEVVETSENVEQTTEQTPIKTYTQEEVDAAYTEVANMYGVSIQEVKDAYGEDNDAKLRKDVVLKKAIAVLEANAQITEEE